MLGQKLKEREDEGHILWQVLDQRTGVGGAVNAESWYQRGSVPGSGEAIAVHVGLKGTIQDP